MMYMYYFICGKVRDGFVALYSDPSVIWTEISQIL